MTGLKRTFLICTLSALTLGATAMLAQDVAAPKDNAAVSSPQAKTEAPPQEGIDLGALFNPQPVNRSCTASTSCATLGGTPIMCSGSSCTGNTSWVLCDGNITYCTCNPSNITSSCRDPQGFCDCWNAAPTNGWGVCRQEFCWTV
ncbi:MAG: hypothetical protein ACJ76N_14715 [Thermoanaerobaculia bacterium]